MSHDRAARIRAYEQPVLLLYVLALVGIPSELVVGPLGAAGTPAGIIAIAMMLWWVASAAVARRPSSSSNPVRWLLMGFALALLLSYLVGMDRPVSTAEEVSSADRAILALVGWCGAVVVVIDGTRTRCRLDLVLQTLSLGGGFIALLGLLQFFFNIDVAHLIHIPGLTANGAIGELIARSNFRRVTGTAAHPIEFGVVLATVAPLAIHFGRFAESRRMRAWSWVAVLLMGAAIPLSVARSGIIGAVIALAITYFTWPAALRRRVLLAIAVGLASCSVVVPGLLGTFRSLFLNAGSDPSTGGRTDDYAPAWGYIRESPLFGRGIGTFIPSLYRTLDNQYLGLLIEAGFVGLLATLALFVGAIVVGISVRRRAHSERERDLALCLVAGVAVMAVNAATFDLFGFAMAVGVLFLLIGSIGAMHSMAAVHREREHPVGRRGAVVVAIVGLATVVGTAAAVRDARPEYHALATVILVPPSQPSTLGLSNAGRTSTVTNVLLSVMESPESRSTLAQRGVTDYDMAVGDGSLMTGTDHFGSGGAVVTVLDRAATPEAATIGLQAVLSTMDSQLARLQQQAGAPQATWAHLDRLTLNPPFEVKGRSSRSAAAGLVLALVLSCCATHLLRRRRGGTGRRRGTPAPLLVPTAGPTRVAG